MVKALGAVIGVIIILSGFACIIISTFLAGIGLQIQPILILGLILTFIGFVVVIIAVIVYLCYRSPILVIPRG